MHWHPGAGRALAPGGRACTGTRGQGVHWHPGAGRALAPGGKACIGTRGQGVHWHPGASRQTGQLSDSQVESIVVRPQ